MTRKKSTPPHWLARGGPMDDYKISSKSEKDKKPLEGIPLPGGVYVLEEIENRENPEYVWYDASTGVRASKRGEVSRVRGLEEVGAVDRRDGPAIALARRRLLEMRVDRGNEDDA